MRHESALAAATALAIGLMGTALRAEPPDLGGDWRLNPELSQDLVGKIKAATTGYETGRDGELRRLRDDLLRLAERGETVEIRQGKGEVQMAYADDDVRIFYPGREHTRERPGVGRIKVVPRWDRDALVIEQALPGGARSVETFSLMDEGRRMSVMMTLESKPLKEPLTARIVYDRAAVPAKP
jgi:hypothetical protein